MTDEQIQRQIDAINTAGKMALRSKGASRKFLIDAGIIEDKKKNQKKERVQQSPSRSHRLPQLQ